MQKPDFAQTSISPAPISPAPLPPAPLPTPSGLGAFRDGLLLSALDRRLSAKVVGRLVLTLPSGRSHVIGTSGDIAEVSVLSFQAVWKCMRRGTIGFADAYLVGEVSTPDLGAVFRFFIDNRPILSAEGRGAFQVRAADKTVHRNRANTREGSKRNISDHYDLGNDFYALWLDAGMSYSSGIYLAPDTTLDASQTVKYDAILDALELNGGESVLEIGCGWGGFVEAAAARGANVKAITISERQRAYTADRIVAAGGRWPGRASVRFCDYRDTTGTFDRVASIEMVEAVGAEHWPKYFQTLHDRLVPGGIAAIQAISIREASFDNYAAKADFIQRFIFPGGMLPTPSHLRRHAQDAGLVCDDVQTFGSSYARTLDEWRRRFHEQWPQIEALGFDDRFRKLWDYYLAYCEAGFQRGVVDVGIYKYRRPVVA